MSEKLREQQLNALCVLTGLSGIILLTMTVFAMNCSGTPDPVAWVLGLSAALLLLLCGMVAMIRNIT